MAAMPVCPNRWPSDFLRTLSVVVVSTAIAFGVAAQAPHGNPSGGRAQQTIPDADIIVVLLRSTLMSLNDALQTGNFTVFRDLGAPKFREANNAARLAAIFGNLAQRGINLSAAAIIAPQLVEAPTIDPQSGMLRIKGFFPGQPVRIDFDLFYEPIDGSWRVFGVSVQPTLSGPNSTAGAQQPPTVPGQGPVKSAPDPKKPAPPGTKEKAK
jgi:hypothetical protein